MDTVDREAASCCLEGALRAQLPPLHQRLLGALPRSLTVFQSVNLSDTGGYSICKWAM